MPEKVNSRINIEYLTQKLKDNSSKLTACEIKRAITVIKDIKTGASSCQKTNLPSCNIANAPSTLENGKEVTDVIAHWLKIKVASGPFDTPPTCKFRVNSLTAVPQEGKVRPCINVSRPKGFSFNDNIEYFKMEKVKMSSARNFGYTVKMCGKNAIMSKFDLKDAYKLVPCPIKDLRLQGFKWLDKFFVETSQMFGARTAVSNFDKLGHTIVTLAKSDCDILPELVHRHLDDVPVVGPEKSNVCQKFSESYTSVCKNLNIPIAENCPNLEKAFLNSDKGKVLGIWFDTSDLSWQLPKEKKEKTLRKIYDAKNNELISVLQMQKLMGNLNNVSMMCPFLNGFRSNLNNDLGYSLKNNLDNVRISSNSKSDLCVWAGCLLDKELKMPIPSRLCQPTMYHKCFSSDAAGCADNADSTVKPAVASIGLSEEGIIIFAVRRFWSKEMITVKKDCEGKRFGNKTALLEFVGILLPFLLIPEKMTNQHIVLSVDNISCHYAWDNRTMKEDVYTSILIRSLHLISNYLCTIVHVKHLPRKTSWDSHLVDRLSRDSTTQKNDVKLLESFDIPAIPKVFSDWLDSPTDDWDLSVKLLNIVKQRVIKT